MCVCGWVCVHYYWYVQIAQDSSFETVFFPQNVSRRKLKYKMIYILLPFSDEFSWPPRMNLEILSRSLRSLHKHKEFRMLF